VFVEMAIETEEGHDRKVWYTPQDVNWSFKVSLIQTLVKNEATSKLAMKPSGPARKKKPMQMKSAKFYIRCRELMKWDPNRPTRCFVSQQV
jgi:hypothetical protein